MGCAPPIFRSVEWSSVGPCKRAGSVPPRAVQDTVAYRGRVALYSLCNMQPLPSPCAPAATSCARLGAAALDPSASLRAGTRAAPVRTNWSRDLAPSRASRPPGRARRGAFGCEGGLGAGWPPREMEVWTVQVGIGWARRGARGKRGEGGWAGLVHQDHLGISPSTVRPARAAEHAQHRRRRT